MIVEVDQDLFETSKPSLDFIALFALCRDERHLLVTEPPYDLDSPDPAISDWLELLPESMKTEVELILDHGLRALPDAPRDMVRVKVSGIPQSDWSSIRLTLGDALPLLAMPLKILIEDRRADFAFLKRLLPPTQRLHLDRAITRRWAEVEHGGGLDNICVILTDLLTAPAQDSQSSLRRLRLWVMFDRDAHSDDRRDPSPTSDQVRQLCEHLEDDWPIGHLQLSRRAIENYLPTQILQRWAFQSRRGGKSRRRKQVEALAWLRRNRPEASWQFNMKHGLRGDLHPETKSAVNTRSIRDEDLDALFQGLDPRILEPLSDGFGRRIASLFEKHWEGDESWFRLEYERGPDGQPTREEIASDLLARL